MVTMTYYKKGREHVDIKHVDKQEKLISLYNQLNGTAYTLDSVAIELVRKIEPGNYIYANGKPDTNFGWYGRTGMPYSKNFSESEKKELQERR